MIISDTCEQLLLKALWRLDQPFWCSLGHVCPGNLLAMSGDRRHPAMHHLVGPPPCRGHRYESSGSGGPDTAQMRSPSFQEACVNLHYAAVEAGVIDAKPEETHKLMVQVAKRRIIEIYQIRKIPVGSGIQAATVAIQPQPEEPERTATPPTVPALLSGLPIRAEHRHRSRSPRFSVLARTAVKAGQPVRASGARPALLLRRNSNHIWRPDGVQIKRGQMATWPNGYIDVDDIDGVKSEEP